MKTGPRPEPERGLWPEEVLVMRRDKMFRVEPHICMRTSSSMPRSSSAPVLFPQLCVLSLGSQVSASKPEMRTKEESNLLTSILPVMIVAEFRLALSAVNSCKNTAEL